MAHEVAFVSEDVCRKLVTEADAFAAVEATFAAMAAGKARNFPVVREAVAHGALYGFKGGMDEPGGLLGVKAGGYFPGNAAKGLINHQSVVALFEPETGRLEAIVGGNYLTAVRTAAAAAVSVRHLAREDAKVLGVLGAGHQSVFQLRAVAAQRGFERIVAWNRDGAKLKRLADAAAALGLPFEAVERERLGAEADVIVTIVSAHEPLIMADEVKPGAHLACMGTDTVGKQEVDPALLARAQVFAEEPSQSVTIGEAQHAVRLGLIGAEAVTPVGAVINGAHPGRSGPEAVTLFDGSGVGLQDLAVASLALKRAKEAGLAGSATL